ncbi:MAG: hypothetical protein WKG06_24805 [Segetibacter sp.]
MKKNKYLQIFNYLLEFSRLKSNPVRDIESSDTQYPDKVWFADIPQYEIFDCITFPNYNQDADYWLKIAKPKAEPKPPTFAKISEKLADWIVKESLTDENGTPVLKDAVINNGKIISLVDKPEVKTEFQTYLNNKWIDDLEFYKKEFESYETKLAEYEKQSKTYKHLFSIYNKAQQFGEEFELIVGAGLLNFQTDSKTPLICRHILISRVEITFDERTFAITVMPTIEAELKLETDSIIDLEEAFDSHNVIEAEKLTQKIITDNDETNPFSNITTQSLLTFAKRFHIDGDYKEDLAKPKEIPIKPTIYFAPALLLRKRNTRSFTALYEKIIENIIPANDTIDIPSINDIIDYFQSPEDFSTYSENESSGSLNDETIYFPKNTTMNKLKS